MDHTDSSHGGDHGGGIHLPDPSIWPLIVGLTFAIVGVALIYYSRDPDASFSGPLLGAAAIIALVAGCGWAYEDGRMKRKAEEGLLGHGERDARYTQVVTFGIAEGQYLASRGENGIISLLEGTDNTLRDLDGFQDLRVIASPAESGVSQVLVETTWADREGLATYDETRTTMLDLLAQNPDQVVPGSVQVFDMEVVRDTKDTSFNFGTGAMVGTFASLIVGGFMIGAGLTLFESDHAGGTGGGGEPVPADAGDTIVARNTKFTTNEITAPPNTVVTLKFDNKDASPPHNVEIFAGSQASGPLLTGCTAGCEGDEVATPLGGGPEVIEFTFTTPAAGDYAFHCLAHPTQMTGTLHIVEGAPVPGAAAAPPAGEGAAGSPTAAP